ncbi:unnamed protein product, partial [Mesorhabditis spiculigera]
MLPPLLLIYLYGATIGLLVVCTVTLYAPGLASFIPAFTLYGKTSGQDMMPLVERISVPKRWFAHFYLIAVIWTGFLIGYANAISHAVTTQPKWVLEYLASMTSSQPHYSWTTGLLALSLIMFHVTRRCQESLFVSVYSDMKMNVFHYIMGIAHYIAFPLTVVCEMHGFASYWRATTLTFDYTQITPIQWTGVAFFLILNWLQNKVAHRLADARKGPTGLAQNYCHSVLYGGWFDLLSSPHFTFEIGIYLSLLLVLGTQGAAYRALCMFVVVNQVFAGLLTDRWYRSRFADYPSTRKAIIPYIL